MKVVLTGTHSTGKTTLINRLAMKPQFENYHVSYSNTRALKDKGLPINCGKSEDFNITQELVLTFHMKDLLKTNLLADRCLVDGLAYTQFLHSKDQVSSETLELFGQMTAGFLHEYDFIFYAPIKAPIEKDGTRDTDETFRLAIDLILSQNLVPNLGKRCFTLPSADLEENIEFIMNTVFGDVREDLAPKIKSKIIRLSDKKEISSGRIIL